VAHRTPLYEWHVAHGGRMVDFADWDMPVQYTSIAEEHQAVRTAAGLFDISHMGRLSFGGPDSLALIQLVYSNNAATLKDGQVRYGLVCNPQGGIRDDVLVYRWPYGYAMVVNASNRAKIVGWLQEHKGGRNVEVKDQTLETCMIAVQGPRALEISRGLTSADADQLSYYHATPATYHGKPCVVSRTGYTGEDGVEIMAGAVQAVELWEELVARKAKPCGLGARDTLRLEASMRLYGNDIDDTTTALEADLNWIVGWKKDDFVGASALRDQKAAGVTRRIVGFEMLDRGIARHGYDAFVGDTKAGVVTSGTQTPYLKKAIGMAYLPVEHAAPETEFDVDIRGRRTRARVVPMPFYKRAK